ncbi:unnamed protein product, partial [Polarella glacialis]
ALRKKEGSLTAEATQLRSELDEAQKAKASLSTEAEAAKVQLSQNRAEIEDARKERVAYASQVESLRTEVFEAKVGLSMAEGMRDAAKHEVEATRSQLLHLREELVKRGLNGVVEEFQLSSVKSAPRIAEGDRVEVEAAWASLIGPGLQRLQIALSTAGLLPSQADGTQAGSVRGTPLLPRSSFSALTESAADAATSPKVGSVKDLATARKGKREREDKGDKNQRPEKKEKKKDKKDKKVKKDRKPTGAKDSEESEEDKDVEERRVADKSKSLKTSPPDQSDDSSESEEGKVVAPLPHRTAIAMQSCLRTVRSSRSTRSKSTGGRGISFRGKSEVEVVSYRHCSEILWFPNPQASVQCERCKRRVPQRLGQLRGGSGASSFMCDEFLCGDCANG